MIWICPKCGKRYAQKNCEDCGYGEMDSPHAAKHPYGIWVTCLLLVFFLVLVLTHLHWFEGILLLLVITFGGGM